MSNAALGDAAGRRSRSGVSPWQAFFISGIGTALEYYDFLVYGLAAGLVFNSVFFPHSDPLVGTLYSFAAFGTGFFARPIGGVVIGHFGDKIGRRKMLIFTLLMMGSSTVLIGCLPSYESIGVAAPILLVLLRLIQGFANGGEWGGASLFSIENAPERRRGLWGSFTSTGMGIGGLIGAIVFAAISWGFGGDLAPIAWRIPFWLGGVLVVIGLVARLSMPGDTEVLTRKMEKERVPILSALRQRPRAILAGMGVAYGYNTIAYLGLTFFLSYLTKIGFGKTEVLSGQLAFQATILISALVFGRLSDVRGRRPVMVVGGIAAAVWLFLYFPVVGGHSVALMVIAFGVTGVVTGITLGPIPTFLGEQFPARMRYSGMSLSYQLGAALGGGTASFIATALLVAFDRNTLSVSVYGAFAVLVLIVSTLALRETSRLSTAELNEVVEPDVAAPSKRENIA